MIQINLLPWREQTRKLNKARFFIFMSIFIALALIVLFFFHLWYRHLFNREQLLNDYLKSEINQEQNIITTLSDRQTQKTILENQLNDIINLHRKNFLAIRFLNELRTLTPNNISLNKISKMGDKITLSGIAQTDVDLTDFKKRIASSPIFGQPTLTEVSAEKELTTINFVLEVIQKDVL